MGGVGAAINLGKKAVAAGDYRWSAELLNHAVFADPKNMQAKALLALQDAIESPIVDFPIVTP